MRHENQFMWNLDEKEFYVRFHSFDISAAFTYGDTRPGHTDKEKREQIRDEASKNFPKDIPPKDVCWAFRIFVKKRGHRPFDIENVPKLIVDAFCRKQITHDNSAYLGVGLYDDDNVDHVKVLQVAGERSSAEESMSVEIFYRKCEKHA